MTGLRRCLLLLALLSLPLPAGAASESQRLRYFVWVGGAGVFDLTLGYSRDETTYEITLEGRLVGVPALFYDLAIAARASGALAGGRTLPARYRLEMLDDGKPEWLQLDYDAEGLPRRSTDPPLGDEGRQPLSDDQLRDTLDPLGALLDLLLQGREAGPCQGRATVFDGRRRFDVTFSDLGAGSMSFTPYNAYSGPVRECRVTLRPRGGFRRSGRDLEAFPRELRLFVGEFGPDRLPLPVRIESDSALGVMVIHLVEAEGL